MLTVEELKIMFESVFGHEINVSELNEDSDLRKDLGMNSISLLYLPQFLMAGAARGLWFVETLSYTYGVLSILIIEIPDARPDP